MMCINFAIHSIDECLENKMDRLLKCIGNYACHLINIFVLLIDAYQKYKKPWNETVIDTGFIQSAE